MKKKLIILISALLLLLMGAVVFYCTPKTFGTDIVPSDVDHIQVIDGTTGLRFSISAPEDIRHIVKNLQSHPMQKSGLSLCTMGYGFKITCVDAHNKPLIPEIILNSNDTIRKDPFFYQCDGGLCYEYIKEIASGINR